MLYALLQSEGAPRAGSGARLWERACNWEALAARASEPRVERRVRESRNARVLFANLVASLKKVLWLKRALEATGVLERFEDLPQFQRDFAGRRGADFALVVLKVFFLKVYKIKRVLEQFFPALLARAAPPESGADRSPPGERARLWARLAAALEASESLEFVRKAHFLLFGKQLVFFHRAEKSES